MARCLWLLVSCGSAMLFHVDDEDLNLVLLQRRAKRQNRTSQWLWMTDFHIDPYYLTSVRQCTKKNVSDLRHWPFGVMACDPPMALAASAVQAAQALPVDMVFSTGDMVRHHQEKMLNPIQNVSQLIGNVSSLVHGAFPGLECVFGALGNDDNPANYFENITTNESSNAWFKRVGAEMRHAQCLTSQELYDYGSFYELRKEKFSILSIATVIYSVRLVPQNATELDPFHQFAWLRERLALAVHEGRKVWILGHIPPGMESFGYTELWHPGFVQQYLDIVQDPLLGSVIALQLFGHVHKDEIRLLPQAPQGAGPILLSSALSPVFRNNPSFKTVTFDAETGQFLNFETYYANLSNSSLQWGFGYGFTQLYELREPSQVTLDELARRLLNGEQTWRSYAEWYTTRYPNELLSLSVNASDSSQEEARKLLRRQQYICAITVRSAESYQSCVDSAVAVTVRDLGAAPSPVGHLVKMIPRSFSEGRQLMLARLLRWAELSGSVRASEVLRLAEMGRWEELWRIYGPKVQKSLELGIPLDELLR